MSERTLILMRHAKSDWSGDEADIDRPLSKRGLREAPRAGQWLAQSVDSIDLAVVSTARRARSTWELASAELHNGPPSLVDEQVYAAPAGQLLGVVRVLPDDADTVVLVGHNPGIEDLVSLLTGKSVSMPTSALAVIVFEGSWSTAGQSSAVVRTSGRPPPEGP